MKDNLAFVFLQRNNSMVDNIGVQSFNIVTLPFPADLGHCVHAETKGLAT